MTEQLEEYILAHIDPEPQELREINRHAHAALAYGHMCSGHLQGRLLKMLAAITGAKRVLEVGTYVGYSALSLAEGLPDDGEVHTIEVDDELEKLIISNLSKSPQGYKVALHIGDAMEIAPSLPADWDIIVIDANKRHYDEYYEMALPLLRKGGLILADNTLWDSKVVDPKAMREPQTSGILRFNDLVARDPRVERVILPLRDGLTLIRKL
ncbi:MAG: class I SAM-dependent methyltransferase [Bacteroidales bacterium]|nr:class I SAM-dependent methyltransferase [Bacteroidales bacterium]